MAKNSKYVSKPLDENGIVHWTDEENAVWRDLVERQLEIVEGRACDEFMQGLDLLNLPKDRIPQLGEVNEVLMRETGWQVAEVPALINFDAFFNLLADKKFPVATFIRTREEFDYLQEPDIFHEIFGHCPLLTNPAFAHFTHTYGKLGQKASKEDRVYLARLYWFTVEFGLMQNSEGLKIYGGGILSSPGETLYSTESEVPERYTLDPVEVLRTPYRIDIMQPVYFTIPSLNTLFDIADMDIMALVEQAKRLGLHAPKFPPKEKLAS
ncbi:phenylalanine 4-monooxygenase [Aestuariibacter sp. AA17]|uniref:Phenylalanine-4-hydroxylase n=1 Tax=Fluctibacter corallii TaxID=2984329 RepID=A0ABT3A395_9ALTE|nr:phenylalanine 4-monooxygenase [Aestuariibacter sp. AA17]MCV2883151.1 phenylalanine 4-monooxygenase [Aestuariibacter sp. AA17]